jgi:hypothetical protein
LHCITVLPLDPDAQISRASSTTMCSLMKIHIAHSFHPKKDVDEKKYNALILLLPLTFVVEFSS